jgi:hypothetical protein
VCLYFALLLISGLGCQGQPQVFLKQWAMTLPEFTKTLLSKDASIQFDGEKVQGQQVNDVF